VTAVLNSNPVMLTHKGCDCPPHTKKPLVSPRAVEPILSAQSWLLCGLSIFSPKTEFGFNSTFKALDDTFSASNALWMIGRFLRVYLQPASASPGLYRKRAKRLLKAEGKSTDSSKLPPPFFYNFLFEKIKAQLGGALNSYKQRGALSYTNNLAGVVPYGTAILSLSDQLDFFF